MKNSVISQISFRKQILQDGGKKMIAFRITSPSSLSWSLPLFPSSVSFSKCYLGNQLKYIFDFYAFLEKLSLCHTKCHHFLPIQGNALVYISFSRTVESNARRATSHGLTHPHLVLQEFTNALIYTKGSFFILDIFLYDNRFI